MNYSEASSAEQAKVDPSVPNSEQGAGSLAPTRIIVGITGASGAVYGIRLLERLRRPNLELHLVVSRAGLRTVEMETGLRLADLRALADYQYSIHDVGARLASGSFPVHGMVIAPCSIRTMSAIATGLTSNLLLRAADVTLKERRRLILMIRESPLHLGHLRTMVALTEMGAIIAPPIPAFYHRPQSVMDLVDYSVERVLDLLGLPAADARRWDP
ncbi:MAG: UbiX family flavin prenyltransferase [Bryobacteraceae bacterium]